MLKAILSAIRGAFAFLWNLIWLPGRLLGRVLGGPISPPLAGDSPLVADLKSELAGRKASLDDHAKVAKAIRSWCVDSIMDDKPAAVPSWLPRDVKGWLPGLTRDECESVISAYKEAVSAHVRKLYALPGVRPVQPLEPVAWLPEPLYVDPAPGFAHFATPRPAA